MPTKFTKLIIQVTNVRTFSNFWKVNTKIMLFQKWNIWNKFIWTWSRFRSSVNSVKNVSPTMSRESLLNFTKFTHPFTEISSKLMCVTTINRIKQIKIWNKSTKNSTWCNKILPVYSSSHGDLRIQNNQAQEQ